MTHPRNSSSEDPEAALERLIGRALHEQPLHRAPHTLQARVLARIGRRARFHHAGMYIGRWGLAARVAFVASACASAMLVVLGWSWLAAQLAPLRSDPLVAGPAAVLRAASGALWSAGELTTQLYRAIPHDWLYGGLLLISILYLMLFGLGAAAYRTLRAGTEAAEVPRP